MGPRQAAACLIAIAAVKAQDPPQASAGCHTYAGCWAQPSSAAPWFDAQTTFRS